MGITCGSAGCIYKVVGRIPHKIELMQPKQIHRYTFR